MENKMLVIRMVNEISDIFKKDLTHIDFTDGREYASIEFEDVDITIHFKANAKKPVKAEDEE